MNNKPYHYVYPELEFKAILWHLDELGEHVAMLRQQVEQMMIRQRVGRMMLSSGEHVEQEGLF